MDIKIENLDDVRKITARTSDKFASSGEHSLVISAGEDKCGSERTCVFYSSDSKMRAAVLSRLLYELLQLTGEKLASQLSEEEARRLYQETSW